ncbi:hypothetical protein HD599_001207 [Conyzicola lurida]|uniref:Right handed beta helix domain-containing protein n=1 Tax=Conyzicola lurida TaxID=1172621 RepID=A0A841AKF2_9MICO|nr:right-handed parallel beta-helix repeat-containing protein [Conyzicola lurida]MBB5842884.1 hypothetical protein [Conyzicola lurida]
MKTFFLRHPMITIVAAAVIGALLAVAVFTVATATAQNDGAPTGEPAGPRPEATPTASSTPTPPEDAPTPSAGSCDLSSPTVSDASELEAALAGAQPGAVIVMAPGSYVGNFVATTSGTAASPITLCGSSESVLDGDDESDGYVFHLDHAEYWKLDGFTVTNGQKGVMADATVGSVIQNLTVTTIGDEAIHLRKGSTDNSVIGNTVSNTGLRKPKFGEGVYIGSAESNWCDVNDCQPDASDRNLIEGNTFSGTTSESIDLKEGSSGGIVRGNSFDGSALVEADSWVDVKGNGYVIENNSGVNSPMDGFQTHEILEGWGTDNVFRGNTAAVNGQGFGFSLTPELDNVVECSNTASGAAEGLTNVTCS